MKLKIRVICVFISYYANCLFYCKFIRKPELCIPCTAYKYSHNTYIQQIWRLKNYKYIIFQSPNRFGLNLFRVHFYFLHFWNQYEKTDILIPHSPYLKKKVCHLLEGTLNTFWELNNQKCKKPLNISTTVSSKQVLDFYNAFKILCRTSKLWNIVEITGPCCTIVHMCSWS